MSEEEKVNEQEERLNAPDVNNAPIHNGNNLEYTEQERLRKQGKGKCNGNNDDVTCERKVHSDGTWPRDVLDSLRGAEQCRQEKDGPM